MTWFSSAVDTFDKSSGIKMAFNQASFFLRGAGGFGGKRTADEELPAAPALPPYPPSFSVTQKTSIDQVWF
jgi:hypothetical protein